MIYLLDERLLVKCLRDVKKMGTVAIVLKHRTSRSKKIYTHKTTLSRKQQRPQIWVVKKIVDSDARYSARQIACILSTN
jgi:hypothetical protein